MRLHNSDSNTKNFVSEAKYVRLTGLSRPTVRRGIEDGIIKAVRTEAGHYRVDTSTDTSPVTTDVAQRLGKIEQGVEALCKQFGIKS